MYSYFTIWNSSLGFCWKLLTQDSTLQPREEQREEKKKACHVGRSHYVKELYLAIKMKRLEWGPGAGLALQPGRGPKHSHGESELLVSWTGLKEYQHMYLQNK